MIDYPEFSIPYKAPEKVVEKAIEKPKTEREKIIDRMKEIEAEYVEISNIPLNHEYYRLRNRI